MKQEMMGFWYGSEWHQLGHRQTICTSLQTNNHTITPSLNFYRPDEARDDGGFGMAVSGISWAIGKQSAPHSRPITTPSPHHSIFTGRMLFLMPNQQCQSTEGKHHHLITV